LRYQPGAWIAPYAPGNRFQRISSPRMATQSNKTAPNIVKLINDNASRLASRNTFHIFVSPFPTPEHRTGG
jgi:hypothetical protein